MMTVVFTESEKMWLDMLDFNWTIKKDCPDEIKRTLESKLALIEKKRD